jgi:hypothetical protein
VPRCRLEPADRAVLLKATGIGHGVVSLIEAAGYRSIKELNQAGIQRVLDDMCRQAGSPIIGNRRKALMRVLAVNDSPAFSECAETT